MNTQGLRGEQVPASDVRRLVILSTLMSFASVSTDIYLPALPMMAQALQAPPGSTELTLSAFLIGFSFGQLIWGPLSDRLGRRQPVLAGIALFIVGSLGCAFANSVWQLMGWRVVQAVGACAGPVLARAMVRDLYQREHSAHILSRLILIMGVAPLIGPLLGGQILAVASWRVIFWALVLVGLAVLMASRLLPESLPPARRRREPLQQALFDYFGLLRDPRLLGYALAGGFFYGGVYAFVIASPFVYIDHFHVSPQSYGWLFAINIVGIMGANFANTKLLAAMRSERLFQMGTIVVAISGMVLAIDARTGFGGITGIVIPVILYTAMNGLIVANSVAGALASFPERAGAASSLIGAMHYGSGILTAAMVGWFADGTAWPMAWLMGVCGVGCFCAALTSSRKVEAENRSSEPHRQAT